MTEHDVLLFIGNFQKKFHQPPTIEEISEYVGSPKKVKSLLGKLVKNGYIERGLIHEPKAKKPKNHKKKSC